MKATAALLVTVWVVLVVGDEKYTTKYDNVDLDDILNNERLVNNYANCLLGKGSCTPDGAELKEHLPEALETDCAKCTEKQKTGEDKVLQHIMKNKPAVWDEVEQMYDPTGEYKKRYCSNAKERGVDTTNVC